MISLGWKIFSTIQREDKFVEFLTKESNVLQFGQAVSLIKS